MTREVTAYIDGLLLERLPICGQFEYLRDMAYRLRRASRWGTHTRWELAALDLGNMAYRMSRYETGLNVQPKMKRPRFSPEAMFHGRSAR